MDQSLKEAAPTIEQQLQFVRGARHLVSNEKREVRLSNDHHKMLTAIEENLLAIKTKEREVSNG